MEKQSMDAVEMDWSTLGFAYRDTPWRYHCDYKQGQWQEGGLTASNHISLHESAGVLQYAQTVFEGLKAYRQKDGNIVLFRPEENAKRLEQSALRLGIPPLPQGRFEEAVLAVVRANQAYVPPFESGASLYIRPFLYGSGPVIGVKPAEEYSFRIFTTPVGPYFSKGATGLKLWVSDFDRAAPRGTGHIKAGLNYAMSLYALMDAKARGYDENMYLDAVTRSKVEETGGANFLFATPEGRLVAPASGSILPSITKASLLAVARDILGIEVEEREVYAAEMEGFAECGLCGTAAVLSPVASVCWQGREISFVRSSHPEGVLQRLYRQLVAIQRGEQPAPRAWIRPVL